MRAVLRAASWLAVGACLPAMAGPGDDPVAWLKRAANSARSSNYVGTVMHVSGERTATTRVTHVFLAGAEHEKIESLDGPRREIVRHNDQMQCFYPDEKTIRIDRRVTARFFPALLNGTPEDLAEHYRLRLGKADRVVGLDCQWVHLDPKDALRYAQRLCAEFGSGLILRAKTLGAQDQVLEQYAFTDLRLGVQVSRGELKSTFHSQAKDWRRDSRPLDEARPVATGWTVSAPPGFRLVGEMQRKMRDHTQPVSQLVLSDGLASMSVFIEPMANAPGTAEAKSADGALSVFVRPMGEHRVTVLGEVPPGAAQQVGLSVRRSAPSAAAK